MVAASAQPKWPERPGAALHDLFYNPRPPTSFGTLPREIPLTRLCLCYYTTTTWTKRVFPSLQPLLFSYKDFLNTDCISRERVLTFREATSQIHGRYKCPFLSRTYLLSSRAGSTNTRTIYITARIQLPKLCVLHQPARPLHLCRHTLLSSMDTCKCGHRCGQNCSVRWFYQNETYVGCSVVEYPHPFWSRGLSRALGRTGSGQDPVDAHESDEHYGASLSNNWRLFWLSLEIGRYGLKHELAEQMPLGLGPRVPERNTDRKCECSL